MLKTILSKMSLREKIGQLLCVNIKGIDYNKNDPDYQNVVRAIGEHHVGCVILFHGDVESAARLLNSLQEISTLPILVGSDIERGVGQILSGGTEFPTNMAFGATYDPLLCEMQGRIVAVEAKSVGIHISYAPVADINSNPLNPIINTRSYGEDPQRVSAFVASYIKSIQSYGVLATAKHFPGHGEAESDSHATLPVLNINRTRFDQLEAIPFQSAIEAGVAQIMTAHIAFPQITHSANLPATLSRDILTRLLRHDLGFKGLIVTDALNMAGVRQGRSESEASILALEAGTDILLYPTEVSQVIDAIYQATISGRITEQRIDQSVMKILSVKEGLGLFENRFTDLNRLSDYVSTAEHRKAALTVARQSITLVCDNKEFIPFHVNMTPQVDNQSIVYTASCQTENSLPLSREPAYQPVIFDEDTTQNPGETFLTELSSRNRFLKEPIIINPQNIARLTEKLAAPLSQDPLIIGIFSKIVSWKERSGLSSDMINSINNLLKSHSDAIVISFASPYIYNELQSPKIFISTYSHCKASQVACAEALFGEIPFRGILPITLKNHPLMSIADKNELNRRLINT